ncbi:MAG TPA: GGDEF domain-containing protein [Anaeromyxobacter sp.]|nr:GGDEF domain-containing protein [Anaeromyxobacter sp.]
MSLPENERTAVARPALGPAGGRHAFLLVLAGPQIGEVFQLAPGRTLLIGRREDADVAIRDDGVSRRHATIQVDAEETRLADLESANGTFVDGVRVRETPLANGARIAIGGATLLKFVWTDEIEARWQIRLAQSAQQDPLTGLYNRRHFEDRLGAELSASLRHGRPLALLLADLDHFKAVNDRHGHLAGDEVLRLTALVLRDAVRKEDVLARYGGEEFVVLARETPLDGGRTLAERLRRSVERTRCAWKEEVELAVTISVGVAVSSRTGSYVEGESERALFAWADRALYLAKERRNAVVALAAAAEAPQD